MCRCLIFPRKHFICFIGGTLELAQKVASLLSGLAKYRDAGPPYDLAKRFKMYHDLISKSTAGLLQATTSRLSWLMSLTLSSKTFRREMERNWSIKVLGCQQSKDFAWFRAVYLVFSWWIWFRRCQVTLERNDFREMPLRVRLKPDPLETKQQVNNLVRCGKTLSYTEGDWNESITSFLGAPSFTMVVVQVRQVKLVGELYNYRLVDSVLVFDSLYQWGCPGRTTAPSIQFMFHAS